MSEPRCSYHPENPSLLACGQCGRRLCGECAQNTPVGTRCPECADAPPPTGSPAADMNRFRIALFGGLVVLMLAAPILLLPALIGVWVLSRAEKIASSARLGWGLVYLAGLWFFAVPALAFRVEEASTVDVVSLQPSLGPAIFLLGLCLLSVFALWIPARIAAAELLARGRSSWAGLTLAAGSAATLITVISGIALLVAAL